MGNERSTAPEAGTAWRGAVAACTMPWAASLAGAYSRVSMNCTGPSMSALECRHMLVETPPGSTAQACKVGRCIVWRDQAQACKVGRCIVWQDQAKDDCLAACTVANAESRD